MCLPLQCVYVCVCVCVCVIVCLCECVREGDKDSLVFSERSRIPCCPKYSETLLFSSVHLLNASWTGGDRGCLFRVITKVTRGDGGGNSAPCPLVQMNRLQYVLVCTGRELHSPRRGGHKGQVCFNSE